jgi:site-specific DNA-methyltransferase (adenine-specific)
VGHYDECRDGYCGICGQTNGNCEHTDWSQKSKEIAIDSNVFCGWQKIDVFKSAFEKKFLVKNILIWDKDWFGMGNNYRPNYEMILLLCKTNVTTKSKNKSNLLKYRRMSSQKMTHSCEKPVALLKDLIEELSNSGEIVFDPFMGSGSCGVASVELDRKFVGIEIDQKYYDITKSRLEEVK